MIESFIASVKTNWQLVYLLYSAVVCLALFFAFRLFGKSKSGQQVAAETWGSIGFALLLFYLIGAARDPPQFLSFFGFGALGAALGYLAGVWLAPSSTSEETRFAKAENLIATLFAGAVGTKLLSLWDNITTKDLIYQPGYYLPLLCCLTGFSIALAAFYTLRMTGQVRITAAPGQFVPWIDTANKNQSDGIPLGKTVQFSGASDFDDDISVSWDLKPLDKQTSFVPLPTGTISPSGLLTAPDGIWFAANQNAHRGWTVVATSNRDRSKFATYDIHFV